VDLLFKHRNIGGIVDVCVVVASNFGGTVKGTQGEDDAGVDTAKELATFGGLASDVLEWERGLYHEDRAAPPPAGGSDAVVVAADTMSPRDARRVCYETMFKFIAQLTSLGEHVRAPPRASEASALAAAPTVACAFQRAAREHLLSCGVPTTDARAARERLPLLHSCSVPTTDARATRECRPLLRSRGVPPTSFSCARSRRSRLLLLRSLRSRLRSPHSPPLH
jgi:hypothetical protein